MANEHARAAKSIILLSDGTGNAASKVWRTNVWRLFQALDLTNSSQVAIYDDGVGTSTFKPLALLGGVFGWGLKRNVLELYAFLCRNYQREANVYAFGFSRGAFTIRVLLGMVANQGLVPYQSEAELQRLSAAAYRAYRAERFHSVTRVETVFRWLRDLVLAGWRFLLEKPAYDKTGNIQKPPIRFVGLWDTVAAYGLPIEEMTRGVSQWIWPLELPDRRLGSIVERACHALAIDDERTTFHPVLWSERDETPAKPDTAGCRWVRDERLSQVWFAGMHANVGGGYPDDSLAHVSLIWIMREASLCGLRLKEAPEADPDAARNARSAADKDGRLYDSRQGLGRYYRYGPRKIFDLCHMRFSSAADDEVTIDLPKIHESAIARTVNGAHAYAPIGFPERYAVVTAQGQILEGEDNGYESPAQARARAAVQERVWNLVWLRRVVYFATLGASVYLLTFPLLHETKPSYEFKTPLRPISSAVRLVGAFLPGFAGWWLDSFAAQPAWFFLGVGTLVTLVLVGAALERTIRGEMRSIWRTVLEVKAVPPGEKPTGFVYRLRTHGHYQRTLGATKRHIVPLISAVLLVYMGLAAAGQLAFRIEDTAGVYCRGSSTTTLATERTVASFDASSICWPTGIELQEGRRYTITLRNPIDWLDHPSPPKLSGSEISQVSKIAPRVGMFLALPLRRVLDRPWFRPIARIGSEGADEYPLDPPQSALVDGDAESPGELKVQIKARRDGELFLYVNDAVFGIPALARWLYKNNRGCAQVVVVPRQRVETPRPVAKDDDPPPRCD